MILSNRKLKLLIISLLLLIFCFFLGMFSPKAITLSEINITDEQNLTNGTGQQTCRSYPGSSNSHTCQIIYNLSSDDKNIINNSSDTFLLLGINVLSTISSSTDYVSNIYSFHKVEIANDNYTLKTTCQFEIEDTYAICRLNHNFNYGMIFVQIGIQENLDATTYINTNIRLNSHYLFGSSDESTIANNSSEINNNIKDSNIDNNSTSSNSTSWNNKNATNSTITNLLTLPISLLTNIVNGLQTSCSSFSLGSLFGTNLTMPCINLSSLLGTTLFNVLDILISGFMIYNIAKKLIKIFNDFTNLKSNQIDELYGGGK